MDKEKQIKTIRKRNAELNQQLEDLKFKLEYNTQMNSSGFQHAKDLITELEEIKQEWENVLRDLEKKSEEYDRLLDDLKQIRGIMRDMGFKIPWYKKLRNRGGE